MKNITVVKIAYTLCTVLSLLICIFIMQNQSAIREYTILKDNGNKILDFISDMKLQEKRFLLHHHEVLGEVTKNIDRLKKTFTSYEKSLSSNKSVEFYDFTKLEDALNIYGRLFDLLLLNHNSIDKNLFEIKNLEEDILAVIFSMMTPERGIIALQEVRIHEKDFLFYNIYHLSSDERSLQDKRREAVSNLLVWSNRDKRIEKLINKDDQLFSAIIKNYKTQDDTLVAMKRELQKIRRIADVIIERCDKKLKVSLRRSSFLIVILLFMWLTSGAAILITRFRS